jgi:hypothetical protein
MAVSAIQLVTDQLEPVFTLDTTLEAAISRQVDAQIALQGWAVSDVTDQRSVRIAILSTKALIPRLLLKFAQEVQQAEAGPAKAVFQDACKFLEALMKELEAQVKAAAWEEEPEDALELDRRRPTGAGYRAI